MLIFFFGRVLFAKLKEKKENSGGPADKTDHCAQRGGPAMEK